MRLRRLSWRTHKWQPNLKTRLTGLRFEFDLAVVPICNNPVTDQQPQPRPGANTLGREERFKYPRLDLGRDSSPIVHNFHNQLIIFDRSADADLAAAIHGIDRIIDEIRPHLVKFAAVSHDARRRTVEGPDYLHLL